MPKTEMSRFPIHDDLTAPTNRCPSSRARRQRPGSSPNFLGVLAGAPAALKAYVRFRAELQPRHLPRHSAERIGLAVAEHYGSKPGSALHTRTSRQVGLGIDEVARAKRWDSGDAAEAALLRYLRPLLGDRARFPQHLHEEAREAGWTEEQLLEAIAVLTMESFTAMVKSPETSPWTARSRRRACARHRCASTAHAHPAATDRAAATQRPRRATPVLPPLPRGRGAGGQALDGRDPLRPAARRSAAVHGDRQRGPGSVGPPAVGAHEGLEPRKIVVRHVATARRPRSPTS